MSEGRAYLGLRLGLRMGLGLGLVRIRVQIRIGLLRVKVKVGVRVGVKIFSTHVRSKQTSQAKEGIGGLEMGVLARGKCGL